MCLDCLPVVGEIGPEEFRGPAVIAGRDQVRTDDLVTVLGQVGDNRAARAAA